MVEKKLFGYPTFDENGEEKSANIAGTYHMGYDYVGNGSYIDGSELLTPINTGGITHVSSELHTQLPLKRHNNIKDGSADDAGVYVLLTINPREFEPKNVSRLYFTAYITTHHGNSITRYFYIQAQNKCPDIEIDPATFTYPGPEPTTMEQAILMMCDAVEAASRSLKEITEETISELVNKIVDGQVSEGHFKNAPITFQDIENAKQVLKAKLQTIYHTRIQYPELKK